MTTGEFEQLIAKQKDKLYRFAFSILKNNEDAQDAVQELVVKLWGNKKSLDKTRNLESYCLNTLKNHCFDLLRKEKHKIDYQNSNVHNVAIDPDLENLDLVEKLRHELQNLPRQQRLAVELKDFQGYNYEEISEILEQSINAVRTNVSRGRKKLHEIFKEELKYADYI
ncbi:RNA polymerase sigma-70 factor, ECF subfamily [Tangfeifania diversioriginum]|uniref:RNA polymerase sigma-70 factor, ECF subfamily n=1 Tax=Tangfeifania diversioriginum TaxID=1168035 RepID=A0A1M6G5G8_9BACT|nr:RNA polymerase sigma factor [Tangfeifania diversioriginum]SHJ05192.1 RNA polymerase sigma-70 factor, ECF subfamily [Tangfeifania diversioriginum]